MNMDTQKMADFCNVDVTIINKIIKDLQIIDNDDLAFLEADDLKDIVGPVVARRIASKIKVFSQGKSDIKRTEYYASNDHGRMNMLCDMLQDMVNEVLMDAKLARVKCRNIGSGWSPYEVTEFIVGRDGIGIFLKDGNFATGTLSNYLMPFDTLLHDDWDDLVRSRFPGVRDVSDVLVLSNWIVEESLGSWATQVDGGCANASAWDDFRNNNNL